MTRGCPSAVTMAALVFMAVPALEQGFPPHTISTDMHRTSFLRAGATMPEVMSKFLAMGMPMAEVVERTTVKPAEWINHTELGTLTPGAPADIAVLEYQDRPCGLGDNGLTGYRIMQAEGRLINQITILDGAVRWDYDGHTKDDWSGDSQDRPVASLGRPAGNSTGADAAAVPSFFAARMSRRLRSNSASFVL